MQSQDFATEFIGRVSPHLAPAGREALTRAGAASVWLKEQTLTLLSVGGADAAALPGRLAQQLHGEVERLAQRHGGMQDRFAPGGTLLFFAEPSDAVRMALELQRTAAALRLRIGVDRVRCVVAAADVDGEVLVTLMGDAAGQAAAAYRRASNGSVFVCPAAYALARDAVEQDTHDCLLAEEFDEGSEHAQATITPPPARGGGDASTFAGLGRL